MTMNEILWGAACLIREHGHRKGTFGEPGWGFCAIGAIDHCAEQPPESEWWAALENAMERLAEEIELVWKPKKDYRDARELIFDWNDERKRTGEEVIEMLERSAVSATPDTFPAEWSERSPERIA
jgi:hypothetical protein